jgi:putative hydrolase
MNKDIPNKLIAERLRQAADLLELQGANRFRVNAYRKAAETVESLPHSAALILRSEGHRGLTALPGIGPLIGAAIAEMVRTGEWSQLERLRGVFDPESLFAKVPGVGPTLARRIIDELHIDSLEALENAAHDGRLARVAGFGSRRQAMVRSALAEMLGRGRWRARASREEPPIGVLLDVDREYREKAEAGRLRRIAPKRFNPGDVAWLPVLHAERGHWHLTALYSNTALAHELGRTRDWVVIYFHTDSDTENQRTIVTETQGPLKGRRVVRGRERECEEYYNPVLFKPPSVA